MRRSIHAASVKFEIQSSRTMRESYFEPLLYTSIHHERSNYRRERVENCENGSVSNP